MLHTCLVTLISFISYTKVHLIHFVIHFHLIHFIDHSPSHSHLTYLVILTLNRYSTSLSRLSKLGVSLDKVLIRNTYCITWCWTPMVLLLLITLKESQQHLLDHGRPNAAGTQSTNLQLKSNWNVKNYSFPINLLIIVHKPYNSIIHNTIILWHIISQGRIKNNLSLFH